MDTKPPEPRRKRRPDDPRERILDSFVVGGRLVQIPARRKKLLVVLEWLAREFDPGARYPEREVNAILLRRYADFASLRRFLVDFGYLERESGIYWRREVVTRADQAVHPAEQPAAEAATLEETWPESQWYAMLFPSPEEAVELGAKLAELAARTGGMVYPNLHVTVGYFTGDADPAEVVALARTLDGPGITVRGDGLFSWSESMRPVHGYSLWLEVIRDDAVRDWQQRALAALAGAGLTPTFSWEDLTPHIAVLRDLPAPPAEVLARLGSPAFRLEFRAARLVVSQRVGEGFVTLLDQPLLG